MMLTKNSHISKYDELLYAKVVRMHYGIIIAVDYDYANTINVSTSKFMCHNIKKNKIKPNDIILVGIKKNYLNGILYRLIHIYSEEEIIALKLPNNIWPNY